MESIPTLSVDLISMLNDIYPVVLPQPGVDREVELYKAGQRSVIDFLIRLQAEQEGIADV